MYEPKTPPGYGDQFYIYAYSFSANGFSTGQVVNQVPLNIQDSPFILRWWAGADSIAAPASPHSGDGVLNIYDWLKRGFFKNPSSIPINFPNGQVKVPELWYPDNSAINMDVNPLTLSTNISGMNTVPTDQICFYGVRRWTNAKSDPEPSLYKYREIEFSIPFQFQLTGNGSATGPGIVTQYQVPISDFDFEVRRIEASKITGGVYAALSPTSPEFAITLYDRNWTKRSNIPINSNRFFHYSLNILNPYNFLPSPPVMYPLQASIRFDIQSLVPVGGTLPTINLTFKGVRRLPCQ